MQTRKTCKGDIGYCVVSRVVGFYFDWEEKTRTTGGVEKEE